MYLVDTNILVYASNADAPEHIICHSLVERLRHSFDPWNITWGILYEYLRVVTHPRVLRRPLAIAEAWRFVTALLASPALRVLTETDRHEEMGTAFWKEYPHLSGNSVFDSHIVILMREHGIRNIFTRDTDFHRYNFLNVIDPMDTQAAEI